MAFYKKRIVRPDTPQDIAHRLRRRAACEQALTETLERFPILTAENFAEADDYRERRIAELLE